MAFVSKLFAAVVGGAEQKVLTAPFLREFNPTCKTAVFAQSTFKAGISGIEETPNVVAEAKPFPTKVEINGRVLSKKTWYFQGWFEGDINNDEALFDSLSEVARLEGMDSIAVRSTSNSANSFFRARGFESVASLTDKSVLWFRSL